MCIDSCWVRFEFGLRIVVFLLIYVGFFMLGFFMLGFFKVEFIWYFKLRQLECLGIFGEFGYVVFKGGELNFFFRRGDCVWKVLGFQRDKFQGKVFQRLVFLVWGGLGQFLGGFFVEMLVVSRKILESLDVFKKGEKEYGQRLGQLFRLFYIVRNLGKKGGLFDGFGFLFFSVGFRVWMVDEVGDVRSIEKIFIYICFLI